MERLPLKKLVFRRPPPQSSGDEGDREHQGDDEKHEGDENREQRRRPRRPRYRGPRRGNENNEGETQSEGPKEDVKEQQGPPPSQPETVEN